MNIRLWSFDNVKSLVAIASCAAMLSACAGDVDKDNSTKKYTTESADPYEPLNRTIFSFNETVDGILLEPVARGYGKIMPQRGRIMVSNFVDNIKEPVTFFNSALQADIYNSFATLWRFMLNSSFGIGGLFDVASEIGLKNRATGFGDTLAIYGAESGSYIVIPFLGPSNIRDGFGVVGDVLMDPLSYTNNPLFYGVTAVKTVNARYQRLKTTDDIYASSIDPYATIRSGHMQYRAGQVKSAIKARNRSLDAFWKQGNKQ